ncbi:MAG: hypothetical protein M1837_007491 [Sclerophora amabilis]|nr:MAG: hypothetical protein M1837_007491 [Sclerophora amabilis]
MATHTVPNQSLTLCDLLTSNGDFSNSIYYGATPYGLGIGRQQPSMGEQQHHACPGSRDPGTMPFTRSDYKSTPNHQVHSPEADLSMDSHPSTSRMFETGPVICSASYTQKSQTKTRSYNAHRDSNDSAEDKVSSKLDGGRRRGTKRPRSGTDDDESSGRKQRGRPRLDTHDENAIDRRRTQIRLAQRAYRHRKETTISALKTRVALLENTIQEMHKTFLRFNDKALESAAIRNDSVLTQNLDSTNRLLLELSNRAETEAVHDLQEQSDLNVTHACENPSDDIVQKLLGKRRISPSQIQPQMTLPEAAGPLGYQFTHETDEFAQPGGGLRTSTPIFEQNPDMDSVYGNASQMDKPIPQLTHPVRQPPRGTMQEEELARVYLSQALLLAPPSTFSAHESTFARHLQRFTVERAYELLIKPSTPDDVIHRVFNLSFCFNNREQILERLSGSISKSSKESLDCWHAPYIHFGGAGTHYPRRDTQGKLNPPPEYKTSQSIGPQFFGYRERFPDDQKSSHMADLACSDGTWFDADDVEGYLHEKGLRFEPHSDHAELDVDVEEGIASNVPTFQTPRRRDRNACSSRSGSYELSTSPNTVATLASSGRSSLADESNGESPFSKEYNYYPGSSAVEEDAHQKVYFDNDATLPQAKWTELSYRPDSQRQDTTFTSLPPSWPEGTAPRPKYSRKKTFLIEIEKLVKVLVDRSVCLGRSPGYRPKDVDLAVEIALRNT